MTIAPFTDDVEVQRRTFRGLRALRDGLQEEGLWLPTLSMGMSADYGPALEEGATVIRLGTALFGQRGDRKSTRLNSSHLVISYAVFCLKKKKRPAHASTPSVAALSGCSHRPESQ